MAKGIYVASPLGFSEAGRLFMSEQIFPLITAAGFDIIDPWTLTPAHLIAEVTAMPYGPEKRAAWQKLNPLIGQNNMTGIDRSIGLLAVLDGVDVDSGTASEIGYAAAQGKPILGYRGDFRLSADNDGSMVNLQVEYFIRKNGGNIVTAIADVKDELTRIFG